VVSTAEPGTDWNELGQEEGYHHRCTRTYTGQTIERIETNHVAMIDTIGERTPKENKKIVLRMDKDQSNNSRQL
jgi:hypothetical protein